MGRLLSQPVSVPQAQHGAIPFAGAVRLDIAPATALGFDVLVYLRIHAVSAAQRCLQVQMPVVSSRCFDRLVVRAGHWRSGTH